MRFACRRDANDDVLIGPFMKSLCVQILGAHLFILLKSSISSRRPLSFLKPLSILALRGFV